MARRPKSPDLSTLSEFLVGTAREVAHLAWVNHGHPDSRRRQCTSDRDFRAAGATMITKSAGSSRLSNA